ncbi:MAG: DUF2845 domain-containing protein [Candidatus Omnitrophota bacterium]|jgi:hypothetical protein
MTIIAILIIIAIFTFLSYKKKKVLLEKQKTRKEYIYNKYGHNETADRIINKTVWVGETADQLRDSLGNPIDIDENVLKTKRKETWKYCQKSTNRFGLKIRVDNGSVVGWDEKL